jgi:FkbM family methyltransferase
MRKFPPLTNASVKAVLQKLLAKPAVHPITVDAPLGGKWRGQEHNYDIVLYGAGHLGEVALDFLQHIGKSVIFALDQNAQKKTLLNKKIPVYTLDSANPKRNQIVLVTTVNAPYSHIARDIKNHGWPLVQPFYDFAQGYKEQHPLNNGWFAGDLDQEDRINIERALNALGDISSKAAYLQFLAWRLIREDWIFENVHITPIENRYFIKQVVDVLTNEECFIDAGAYDGRVLKRFLEISGQKFSSAHLYEADVENHALLKRTLDGIPSVSAKKIHSQLIALSDVSGVVPFSHGFGMTSRLSEIQASPVSACRLDDLDIKPSFIKLHLEGSEYRTLLGGMQTLIKNRPILAITIYHSREGLWKLPILLIDEMIDYRFYFRMDAWCGTGAIFYGLPLERF